MQTIEISEKMKLFKEGLYSYEQIKEDTINFLYNYFNKYFKNPLYEDDSFIALTKILENADKMINNFKLYDYSCYKNY